MADMQKPRPTKRLPHSLLLLGPRAIDEALEAGRSISKIVFQQASSQSLRADILTKAQGRGVPCQAVPKRKLDQLTDASHQGIIGFLSPIPFYPLERMVTDCFAAGRLPLIVALDGVTNVGNAGAIVRSTLCLGGDGLLLPATHSAQIGPDLMKASAGALSHLPISRTHDLHGALGFLKASGLQLVACDEKATLSLQDAKLQRPLVLLLGDEERGISPRNLALADMRCQIPLQGPVASLNVAATAAIFLAYLAKQI